jgi:hypothetical protein
MQFNFKKILLYLSILFSTVATVMAVYQIPRYFKARESIEWPNLESTITSKKIGAESGGNNGRAKYYWDIVYQYTVDEMIYSSSQISFGKIRFTDEKKAKKKLDDLGDTITVYYDPDSPEEAVLYPGVDNSWYRIGLLLFMFLLIGYGGLYMYFRYDFEYDLPEENSDELRW